MFKIKPIIWVTILSSLLLIGSVRAQEATPAPLLQLLALVPDTESVRTSAPIVSYADYDAIGAARGIDSMTPQEITDRTESSRLWLAAMNGLYSGPRMDYMLRQLGEMTDLVGFEWTDVNQALEFGQPPGNGKILAADFDAEVITTAFTNRNFSAETTDDVTLFCGPLGCGGGLTTDLNAANPVNPFGGQLGRQEPVAIAPGYLFNSADINTLDDTIGAYTGDTANLGDNPYFATAANALLQVGTLRQAQFYSVVDVGFFPPIVSENGIIDTSPKVPIQPYALAAFGDVYLDDQQFVVVTLIYDEIESAQNALPVLDERAANYQSLRTRQPFSEILEATGAEIQPTYMVKDEVTGKYAVLLVISYPMPPNERQDADGLNTYLASSLMFRFIISDVFARAFTIISVEQPLPD